MRRRAALTALAAVLCGIDRSAFAQATRRVFRLGLVSGNPRTAPFWIAASADPPARTGMDLVAPEMRNLTSVPNRITTSACTKCKRLRRASNDVVADRTGQRKLST